jgi:hypothetical protein
VENDVNNAQKVVSAMASLDEIINLAAKAVA